jgi:hypothetical protein
MRTFAQILLAVAFIGLGMPVVHADASAASVARLVEQINQRKTMMVDKSEPEMVWSDGAMLEVNKTFPGPIQEVISRSTNDRPMRPIIARFLANKPEEWKDARIGASRDNYVVVESTDGKLKLHVAAVYMNYLRERYPRAKVRVQGELSPVLFMIDGAVRATVMPIKTSAPPPVPKEQR